MVESLQQQLKRMQARSRSSQHSMPVERGPLQERLLNLKLKELQYQQLKLQEEVEASKHAIELNHHALLGRFDALENQLQQAPKRGARLPHTLTVSLATGTKLRTYLAVTRHTYFQLQCKKAHTSYDEGEKFDFHER